MPTTAVPNILQEPGYLFRAPLLTAEPANTVVGSKFTDAWPVAWISIGATNEGNEFTYATKVEAVYAAEFLDPIKWATTGREGNVAFTMIDWTLNNLKFALNGGTVATVSGTGATLLSSYVPPAAGSEVRSMVGWESLDNTVRGIFYQCIQGGEMKMAFKKSPDVAGMAVMMNFEVPSAGGNPFKFYTAGTARVGTP